MGQMEVRLAERTTLALGYSPICQRKETFRGFVWGAFAGTIFGLCFLLFGNPLVEQPGYYYYMYTVSDVLKLASATAIVFAIVFSLRTALRNRQWSRRFSDLKEISKAASGPV